MAKTRHGWNVLIYTKYNIFIFYSKENMQIFYFIKINKIKLLVIEHGSYFI